VLGGGRLLGVVVLAHARQVPSEEAPRRRVEEVMTPLDDVPMVDATDSVVDVVGRLNGTNPTGQVVVVADGCVVGILDEDDVAGALDRAPLVRGGRAPGARAWAIVAAVCLVAGAALFRPPFVIVSRGTTADVTRDVAVVGISVTPVNGRYVVPDVAFQRTNGLATLIAAVRDHRRVVPVSRVRDEATVPGVTREVRILAAAAAALSQGLPATVTGTGAKVAAVRSGSPAAGVLHPGDVILAVDGQPVTQAAFLAEVVRAGAVGTAFSLSVERGGQVNEIPVTSAAGGLGITVETRDLAVELPFEVRFEGRAAGGPDAGLAYALAIADILSSRDVAQGRTIAAAGTVDADGHVGPAHPLTATASTQPSGAAVVVLPQEQADGARRDGVQVVGVESLARALEALSPTV
jgi:PDZ domain-containing protein